MADELDMREQDGTASQDAVDRRSWPRRIAWVVVVLLAVAVLNKGVSFVFEHYGSTSELTWAQYRMAERGSLDTVILGNSAALSDFDPYTLDEELGSSTFNLAFYALSNRYVYSALERAIDDHGVTRAYLGLSIDSMENAYTSTNTMYTEFKMVGEPIGARVADLWRLASDPNSRSRAASLEILFPWSVNNQGNDPEVLRANVEKRLTYSIEELASGSAEGVDTSKGHRPDDPKAIDPNEVAWDVPGPSAPGDHLFEQARLDELEAVAELCERRGVELYVVVTPRPSFEVVSMGADYPASWGGVQEVVERHGAHFMDMSLLREADERFADDEFCDLYHLNIGGATRFSKLMASLVTDVEAGKDVSGRFLSYDEWDAYQRQIDDVRLVNFTAEREGGELRLQARGYSGSETKIEYAFEELDAETGAYVTLRGYDVDPACVVADDGQARTIRVLARTVGSEADCERFCEHAFEAL